MRFIALALVMVVSVFWMHPADRALAQQGRDAMLQAAVSGYVRPAYERLEEQAEELEIRVDALCGRPSDETLQAARGAFAVLLDAWSRVEFVHVGPAGRDGRAARFSPLSELGDGAMDEVRAVLEARDVLGTGIDALRVMNVAVQGLGALEMVLYGEGNSALVERRNPFRCAYAHAIATNLGDIAAELAAGWAEGGMADAAAREDMLAGLLGALVRGVTTLGERRLDPLLAQAASGAAPPGAVYALSGNTLPVVRANLEGLRALYGVMGASDLLAGAPETSWIDGNILFEFRHALAALDEVSPALQTALADEAQRGKLSYVRVVMDNLRPLLAEELPLALGFPSGNARGD